MHRSQTRHLMHKGRPQNITLMYHICEQVVAALEGAANVPKPPLSDLFTDVYAEMPANLEEQRAETFELLARHPELLPADVPLR